MDIKETNIYKHHETMDLNDLVNGYNEEFNTLLDLHAPLVTRHLTTRRREPWFHSDLRDALRTARSHERIWRKNRTDMDKKQQFINALNNYHHILKESKQAHFLNIMENNAGNQQKLFQAMDKAMHRSTKQALPDHTDPKDLANKFCNFFQDKVEKIRSKFEDISEETYKFDSKSPCVFPPLSIFRSLSIDEVRRIIVKSASKSCELDPLPTSVLKQCIDEMCPIITSIVNKSLANAEMPSSFK